MNADKTLNICDKATATDYAEAPMEMEAMFTFDPAAVIPCGSMFINGTSADGPEEFTLTGSHKNTRGQVALSLQNKADDKTLEMLCRSGFENVKGQYNEGDLKDWFHIKFNKSYVKYLVTRADKNAFGHLVVTLRKIKFDDSSEVRSRVESGFKTKAIAAIEAIEQV